MKRVKFEYLFGVVPASFFAAMGTAIVGMSLQNWPHSVWEEFEYAGFVIFGGALGLIGWLAMVFFLIAPFALMNDDESEENK